MISSREQVTQMIVAAKVRKGLKWAHVAESIGMSKEWTTAGCLGQMAFDKAQAETLGQLFELSDEAVAGCRSSPQRLLPTAVPTDPLIYRWYELVNVYGTTIKELIHEEFGDGIMSAIDFSMDIQRQSDPRAIASTWCCPASSCPTRATDGSAGADLPARQAFHAVAQRVRRIQVRTTLAQRRSNASRWNSAAYIAGVCPALLRWLGSHSVASRRLAMPSSPLKMAPSRAVLPRLSSAQASAPAASRRSTVSPWPL